MYWIAGNFLPFIVILTILVFIHELGHFLVARYNGVKVTTFSIGFGPELFGWTDKHNTRWCFSLIPLGGYVKMLGDADPSSTRPDENTELTESEKQHTLHHKTPWQQIAVAAAGPAANLLFAAVALSGLIMIKGVPTLEPIIAKVESGMLAEKSGLWAGDKILKIGNTPIKDFQDLKDMIAHSEGQDVIFEIERAGEVIQTNISFYEIDSKTQKKLPIKRLGVSPGEPQYIKHNPLVSIQYGLKTCWTIMIETLKGLGSLMIGKSSAKELGGILSIGDMAAQSTKNGLSSVLWLISLLSINLALINLLPIPVLDGGHILLCAIAGIRGKPLSAKTQERIFLVGFLIVGTAMLYATWNDLMRYNVFKIIKKWL